MQTDAISEPTTAVEPRIPSTDRLQPEEIVIALVTAERESAIAADLHTVRELWSADARIVDGRTTITEADDYVWNGLDAILDRYQLAVFPSPPPPVEPSHFESLRIVSHDERNIQAELGVDRWTLVKRDGLWQLQELRYN